MYKTVVFRNVSSPILSIISGKYILQNFKFSCQAVYQWKIGPISPATIKLVLRTSSSFSKVSEAFPFSIKYHSHFKPHVWYYKTKSKVDLSREVRVIFSSCNYDLFYSDNDRVGDFLQFFKSEATTLDDIQVKNNGAVKCQDKDSVISRFNINLVHNFGIQKFNNFHLDMRNIYQEKEAHYSVSDMKYQDYLLQPNILNCLDLSLQTMNSQPNSSPGNQSNEHLSKIYDHLCQDLPYVFVKILDYSNYNKDLIFENRINGTKTVGLVSYIRQVHLMRIIGHLKYAYVKFDILKISKHPEDSTIRLRWRITGLSALKSFGMVWRQKIYSTAKFDKQMTKWHDGFSVFYVGSDGLIFKHVADKMIPDEERVLTKPSLISRLASLIVLKPKTPAPQSAMTSVKLSNNKSNLSLEKDIISVVLGDMQSMVHTGNNCQ